MNEENPPPAKKENNSDPRELELPEPVVLPPLPPVGERPTLVLDAGGHTATVKRVFITPDRAKYITVSNDKTVRVWDAETGTPSHTFRLPVGAGNEGALSAGALSPDGKNLAVAGFPLGLGKYGMLVYMLSLETGAVERVFKGHRSNVTCLAFSANGKWLASGSFDNTALIYKVEKIICE